MKTLKNFILTLCLSLFVLLLSGCGETRIPSITNGDFMKYMTSIEFSVTDVIDFYSDKDYIKTATVAKNTEENWQVEFYTLDNDENTSLMFAKNKTKFESVAAENALKSAESGGNYERFELSDGYEYMYISRIDNTLFFAQVPSDYEDDTKKIIESLGY